MRWKIDLGSRVAFSARYLRDTVQQASLQDKGGWRGVVVGIEGSVDWRLCEVDWKDRDGRPLGRAKAVDTNLAIVGSPEMSVN